MATFEEVMQALKNADAAGRREDARVLARIADRMLGGIDRSDVPGRDVAALPPRVEAQEAQNPTPRVDRFGDTIAAAMEAPAAATRAFAGGLADQTQSPTMRALPDGMNPTLSSVLAYGGDAAMTGLNALGTGFAFAAGAAGEALGGTPTGERQLARDLMMAGSVAVPELAGVSGTVQAGARAARAADRLAQPPTEAQAAARAADELGITPSLAMQGKTPALASAALEKVPFAAGRIEQDAVRVVGEVERAFQAIASRVGTAMRPENAGQTLQRGLGRFVEQFRARSRELFDAVGRSIPASTQVQSPNSVAVLRETLQRFEGNPNIAASLGLTRWAGIADDLERGMSWEAIKDFRSSVGESIGKLTGPMADMDGGRLKQLYATLTEDMAAAARAAGPEAERAWRRANAHYRAGATRIEDQLDRTISANSPERAFEAFDAMTQADRSSADVRRMRAIRQSLSDDDWRDISASIVDRLGRARPGQQNAAGDAFSPSTFLTEWNRMSPEAKRLLLPSDVRTELEQLAAVAARVRDAGAERNFSNTGTVVAATAMGAGAMQAPITTALTTGGLYLSARGMTNVTFLRALNRAARGDRREIEAMARGNGPFAVDARTVLQMTAAETAATAQPANNPQQPVRAVAP